MVEISSKQLELVRMYIGELMGLKSIGFKINSDPRTFKEEITSLGIEIPFPGSLWCKVSQHFRKKFFKPIHPWLEEVIIGSLLGDAQLRLQSRTKHHSDGPTLKEYEGTLKQIDRIREKARRYEKLTQSEVRYWNHATNTIKRTNTANFRIHKSILEFEWVKLLIKEFEKSHKVTSFIKPINTLTTKWSCGFDTISSIQLFNIWKEWYEFREIGYKKKIPKLPPLAPNILLHWYIGDGYYTGKDISICTHGFSFKEQKILSEYLKTVGIQNVIRKKKNYYYLGISVKNQNKKRFFDFIEQASLFEKAYELFPYKFSNQISKKEWKDIVFKQFPEYTQSDKISQKKLLDYLNKK